MFFCKKSGPELVKLLFEKNDGNMLLSEVMNGFIGEYNTILRFPGGNENLEFVLEKFGFKALPSKSFKGDKMMVHPNEFYYVSYS